MVSPTVIVPVAYYITVSILVNSKILLYFSGPLLLVSCCERRLLFFLLILLVQISGIALLFPFTTGSNFKWLHHFFWA